MTLLVRRYLPLVLFAIIIADLTILALFLIDSNALHSNNIKHIIRLEAPSAPRNNQLVWLENSNAIELLRLNSEPSILLQETENGRISIFDDSLFDYLFTTELKGNPNFANYTEKRIKKLKQEKGLKEYLESAYKRYDADKNIIDSVSIRRNLAFFIFSVAKQAAFKGDTFFIASKSFHYNPRQVQSASSDEETIVEPSALSIPPLVVIAIILLVSTSSLFYLANRRVSRRIIVELKEKPFTPEKIKGILTKVNYSEDLDDEINSVISGTLKDVAVFNKDLSANVGQLIMEGKKSILLKNSLLRKQLTILDVLCILKRTYPEAQVIEGHIQLLADIKSGIERADLTVEEDRRRRIQLSEALEEVWNDPKIKTDTEAMLLSEFRFQFEITKNNTEAEKIKGLQALIKNFESKHDFDNKEYTTLFEKLIESNVEIDKERTYLSHLYNKYCLIRSLGLRDYYKFSRDESKRAEIKKKFVNNIVEFSFHALDHISERISDLKLTSPETIAINKKIIISGQSLREILNEDEYVVYQANATMFSEEMDFVELLNEIGVTSLDNVIIKGTYYPQKAFDRKS